MLSPLLTNSAAPSPKSASAKLTPHSEDPTRLDFEGHAIIIALIAAANACNDYNAPSRQWGHGYQGRMILLGGDGFSVSVGRDTNPVTGERVSGLLVTVAKDAYGARQGQENYFIPMDAVGQLTASIKGWPVQR